MINFPYALDAIPAEQYGAMNAYIESTLNSELLNIAQVKEEYKISHQSQYQMIKDNKIPGHFMIGSSHLYLACLAKPWFEQYVAKQIARASAKEAKKEQKGRGRGRPKKDKREWEYTLFGQTHKSTLTVGAQQTLWANQIHRAFPQYFEDEACTKFKPELMHDHDPQFTAALAEVFSVFQKAKAENK